MKELDVLKVDFFPRKNSFSNFPHHTKEAYLQQTAKDMLHLLTSNSTTASPVQNPLAFGPPILHACAMQYIHHQTQLLPF
jgi:hypothetical protein